MDNSKDMENFTLPLVTITLESSNSIRRKAVVCIDGPERNRIFTKVSSSLENVMGEVHSGGLMAAGTKAISRKECNAARECFTEKVAAESTKAAGKMECSTVRESNTLTMASDMKAFSKKISSMGMVSFTKTIQSFMVSGKITNCL